MNANKEAVLLRLNKERQVEALNRIGFTDVTMDTPLSEIAEYIKWAGGLRDLRLAAMKILPIFGISQRIALKPLC